MSGLISRSRTNVMIGGVCSGLADFIGVSPLVIRLFFLILIFGNGIGIFLYILLWIVIPLDGNVKRSVSVIQMSNGGQERYWMTKESSNDVGGLLREPQFQVGLLVGILLILAGFSYLLPILRFQWLTWLKFDLIWPVLLIFGGLALLIRRPKGVKSNDGFNHK
jgi:phage shock protein C